MRSPKFLIITTNRTGSTVLRRTLNDHPALNVEDEIFLFDDKGYFEKLREKVAYEVYPRYELRELNWESDLIPLILSMFEHYNGFKIQICAKQIHKNNPAWVFLSLMPDLKIIHMRRRNKIDQMISLELANARDIWHLNKDQENPEISPIHVNPETCITRARHFEHYECYFKKLFCLRDSMEVWYEDLNEDIDRVVGRVQKFLGVEQMDLEVPMKKVITKPTKEFVTNYDEIVKAAKGTRWESML
jgi:LPS sulfotransferase NodH